MSRQLKKAEYHKITLGVVERYHTVLQQHRPELFPSPPAPSVKTSIVSGENIAPFKKPNGDDGPNDDGPATA